MSFKGDRSDLCLHFHVIPLTDTECGKRQSLRRLEGDPA